MKILQLWKIHFLLFSMAYANKKNLQTKTLLHQKTGLHQSFKAEKRHIMEPLDWITTFFRGSHFLEITTNINVEETNVLRYSAQVHSETMRHSDTDHMTLSWFQPNLNPHTKYRLNTLAMLETNISNTWLIPKARFGKAGKSVVFVIGILATAMHMIFYRGVWIGILILVHYNPYINGYYKPLYTLNKKSFSSLVNCFLWLFPHTHEQNVLAAKVKLISPGQYCDVVGVYDQSFLPKNLHFHSDELRWISSFKWKSNQRFLSDVRFWLVP